MRIQIITRDNGWGLSHDIRVLSSAIGKSHPSAIVEFTDWRSPKRDARFDINIFLELVNEQFFGQAPRNIIVPNPEWYISEWLRLLDRGITEVWAKTYDAKSVFSIRHKNTKYSGWTSDDRILDVPREKRMVHLAGGSSAKGTEAVVEAMRMLPDLSLTLVSRVRPGAMPDNIEWIGRMDDAAFRLLQNTATIHLCPSSYEGFGHYINEARSVGAVVITTNAAPMSELAHPSYALGAGVKSVSNQNLAQHKHVDPESLAEMISGVHRCSIDALLQIGARARSAYLADRATFEARVAELIAA